MKTLTKTLLLAASIFFSITVSAQNKAKIESKTGFVLLDDVNAATSPTVVDRALDGRVDAGHGDNVDKNWVKIKVYTSKTSYCFATVDGNLLGYGIQGVIRKKAREQGYCMVSLSTSLYSDNPYAAEVDPSTVSANAPIMSLAGAAGIYSLVSGPQ